MRNTKKWLLLLLVFPLALMSRANGGKMEGVLHGYVLDAVTKKPLPGVTVFAMFPGSMNSKEVLTDADGYFRFAQLPATQVTVFFDKKGYQPYKRPGVTVKEKASVKLNVEFFRDEVVEETDNSEYPILRMLHAG